MTAAEFKRKWGRYQGKETSAYQEHFSDLCRLLGQPTPNEADPSGADFFCFQKRVVKDAELFELHDSGEPVEPGERGFADVWKKNCFGWEYKGKKKNLDEAYKQLLRYREALANPPLLVVCDFDRYIIRTNFTGTVQETHEFTNADIDRRQRAERVARTLAQSAGMDGEKTLEFPGSTGGPWQRYLDAKSVDAKTGVGTVRYPRLEPRDADCAAKLKKRTLTNLYNERPAWLDLAHKKLDAAVATAYGFPTDLTDEQILEKLLVLNLERAAEEAKAAKVRTPKAQRAKHTEEMI